MTDGPAPVEPGIAAQPPPTEAPQKELDLTEIVGHGIRNRFLNAQAQVGHPDIFTDSETGWQRLRTEPNRLPPTTKKPVAGDLDAYTFYFSDPVSHAHEVEILGQPPENTGTDWSFTKAVYRRPIEERPTDLGEIVVDELRMTNGVLVHIRRESDMVGGAQKVEKTIYDEATSDEQKTIKKLLRGAAILVMDQTDPRRAQLEVMSFD